MAVTTVAQLAAELNRPASTLLEQLQAAGVKKASAEDTLNESDKERLLEHLRTAHGTGGAERKKITLTRKSTSEIKQADASGKARTIQVEVRKKRVFVKRDDNMDEATAAAAEEAELKRREEEAQAQAESLRQQEEELARKMREREEAERAAREAEEKRREEERLAREAEARAAAEAAAKAAAEEEARRAEEAKTKAAQAKSVAKTNEKLWRSLWNKRPTRSSKNLLRLLPRLRLPLLKQWWPSRSCESSRPPTTARTRRPVRPNWSAAARLPRPKRPPFAP